MEITKDQLLEQRSILLHEMENALKDVEKARGALILCEGLIKQLEEGESPPPEDVKNDLGRENEQNPNVDKVDSGKRARPRRK